MATINGVRAPGLGDEAGLLGAGKAADVAVCEIGGPGWSETSRIEVAPVRSGSGRDRRLVRQDLDAIRRDHKATHAAFWGRDGRGERAA